MIESFGGVSYDSAVSDNNYFVWVCSVDVIKSIFFH